MGIIKKNNIKESHKPIFIFNLDGIFDDFILHIKKLCTKGFTTHKFEDLEIYVENDYHKMFCTINNVLQR